MGDAPAAAARRRRSRTAIAIPLPVGGTTTIVAAPAASASRNRPYRSCAKSSARGPAGRRTGVAPSAANSRGAITTTGRPAGPRAASVRARPSTSVSTTGRTGSSGPRAFRAPGRGRRGPGHCAPDDRLDLFGLDAAGSQDHRITVGHVEDRRLDADRARAAIEHEVDRIAEIVPNVLGRGRAGAYRTGWPTARRPPRRGAPVLAGSGHGPEREPHRRAPAGHHIGTRPLRGTISVAAPARMHRARRRTSSVTASA